jgi:hypothetical protein
LNPGPSGWEANRWTTGPVELRVNAVRLQALHRAPPQQLTLSVVKLEGGHTASVKTGQKSCVRLSGIVTVRDEAHLRRGQNDQGSRWGHQCSETTLTGESRFHISTPLGIEPGSFMMGSKRVDH